MRQNHPLRPPPPAYPFDTNPTTFEDIIANAARPLARDRRAAFVAEASAMIRESGITGEGATFRFLREIQKRFFDPPLDPAGGKYSRGR
jgi:hypothetical protein